VFGFGEILALAGRAAHLEAVRRPQAPSEVHVGNSAPSNRFLEPSFLLVLLLAVLLVPSLLCNCAIVLNAIGWSARPFGESWTWQWIILCAVFASPYFCWIALPFSYKFSRLRPAIVILALISLVPTWIFLASTFLAFFQEPYP